MDAQRWQAGAPLTPHKDQECWLRLCRCAIIPQDLSTFGIKNVNATLSLALNTHRPKETGALLLFRFSSCHSLTFQLRVGDAAPLPPSVSDTGAPHHVSQDVVAFVPLVSHSVHHPLGGRADFLVS